MNEQASKNNARKQPMGKWSAWGMILAIFIAISLPLNIASGLITAPTSAHREAITKRDELMAKVYSQNNPQKTPEYAELMAVESRPEIAYTNIASIFTTLVQIVVWVTFIGLAFNYLRKNHIGTSPARAVALIDAIGSSLLTIPLAMLAPYIGYSAIRDVVFAVMIIPLVFILSLIPAYLVARLFQWRYERKYNFTVE